MQPDVLAQSLQDCDEIIKSLTDENNEDYSFCRSLVPMLKGVSAKGKTTGQN